MIHVDQIFNHFPPILRENINHKKYLIKEYLQLLILDFLSTTKFVRKIAFIGGTNLRLVKGIDRFSEDLDFDCRNFSLQEFNEMTDSIIRFLNNNGLKAIAKDKANPKLSAYQRNIHIPGLLYEIGLSGYKEERFLIKIESEDQQYDYPNQMKIIQGCGFYFSFPMPSDEILCAMKFSALISRSKGRDFYDAMFLSGICEPDYLFLKHKLNIHNKFELKENLRKLSEKVDIKTKAKDFEHLIFDTKKSIRILDFENWIENL
jgi:predicted nucleotidyltransferase component of viral defense system